MCSAAKLKRGVKTGGLDFKNLEQAEGAGTGENGEKKAPGEGSDEVNYQYQLKYPVSFAYHLLILYVNEIQEPMEDMEELELDDDDYGVDHYASDNDQDDYGDDGGEATF